MNSPLGEAAERRLARLACEAETGRLLPAHSRLALPAVGRRLLKRQRLGWKLENILDVETTRSLAFGPDVP